MIDLRVPQLTHPPLSASTADEDADRDVLPGAAQHVDVPRGGGQPPPAAVRQTAAGGDPPGHDEAAGRRRRPDRRGEIVRAAVVAASPDPACRNPVCLNGPFIGPSELSG